MTRPTRWLTVCALGLFLAGCMPDGDLSEYSNGAAADPASAHGRASEQEPPITAALFPTRSPPAADDARTGSARAGSTSSAGKDPAAAPSALEPAATACARNEPRRSAARCSGMPGRQRGKVLLELDVGRSRRRFIYYAPEALAADEPAAVLIVPHGFSRSAQEMFDITGYDRIAEREGFVVLYPEGQGLVPWNVGEQVCEGTRGELPSAAGNDQAFVDAMLDFVRADRCVDAGHVFVAGFGMGGYLATESACQRTDLAGIASHSGGSHELTACPGSVMPALFLHGQNDAAVPPACSSEARDRFAERNGCRAEVQARPVLGGVCEFSLGCPEGGQVVMCLFDELAASWAGSSVEPARVGSASELSWEFFSTCAW